VLPFPHLKRWCLVCIAPLYQEQKLRKRFKPCCAICSAIQASCTPNMKVSTQIFRPINFVHLANQTGGILHNLPTPTQGGTSSSTLVMTTSPRPHKFHILFNLHGDRTVILLRESSKNILLSAIFPCARLLAWTRPADSLLSCLHARDWWFELTNESAECNLNFLHARDRWFELTNESAECKLDSCSL